VKSDWKRQPEIPLPARRPFAASETLPCRPQNPGKPFPAPPTSKYNEEGENNSPFLPQRLGEIPALSCFFPNITGCCKKTGEQPRSFG